MDVAIAGSSGLIGTALRTALSNSGHRPIRLVRRPPAPGQDEIAWDPAGGTIDTDSLEGIDAVVNLAGAGVGDSRWTDAYKQLLVISRVTSTDVLATALAALDRPPAVFLSGSAIGYYGSQGETTLTEQSPPGTDFLARLCVDWEAAARPAVDAGIRTVFLRTGIVLSRSGGALGRLLPLFRAGLGGRMGSGRQYWSWIIIEDEINAIRHLLDHPTSGPVNLTAPEPATNADFASTLAEVLGRPAVLPVPAFGPRLLLGAERADALVFDSVRALPAVLERSGYTFHGSGLRSGLQTVLGR